MGALTVVIPVWGSYVRFLPEAVASVCGSSAAASIVVVDNANQPPLAAPRGCEVIRSDEPLTRGTARNLGLAQVNSEYVLFLDADDLLCPGAPERLLSLLEQSPGSAVAAGRILEPSGALHRTPRRFAVRLASAPRLFAWANAVWPCLPIQGCAVLRSSAVRDAGGYPDASLLEDWSLASALAFRGPVRFDTQPSLVYRLWSGSPGESAVPARSLLRGAQRIRRRMRQDPAIAVSRRSLALLALAQLGAVTILRPLVRAVRRRPTPRAGPSIGPGRARCRGLALRAVAPRRD